MLPKELLIKLELIYRSASVKTVYQKTPPGILNVTRLINQQAPWVRQDITNSSYQKKKLIINNWYLNKDTCTSAARNISVLTKVLKLLFKDIFEIYYYADNRLVKVTKKNPSLQRFQNRNISNPSASLIYYKKII